MPCPYCAATVTSELRRRTTLGYRMFRCRACRRTCNERTGTPLNHLQVPTDDAVLVVLWRLQYKLSLRNVAAAWGIDRVPSHRHQPKRRRAGSCSNWKVEGFCLRRLRRHPARTHRWMVVRAAHKAGVWVRVLARCRAC